MFIGFYSETCMFNGHGTFTASTVGFANQYVLIAQHQPLDLEFYTLTPVEANSRLNATHNCQVEQVWRVYDAQTSSWALQGSSNQTNVNVLGQTVYLTPGVVPVNGMCVMQRLSGNACVTVAQFILGELEKRNFVFRPAKPDPQAACFW